MIKDTQNYEQIKEAMADPHPTIKHPFLDIDFTNKKIYVHSRRTVNEVYSGLQDLFDQPELLQYPIPMSAQTPEEYSMINGWNFADDASKQNLSEGGWRVVNGSDAYHPPTTEMWVGVETTGGDFGQLYYSIDNAPLQKFTFSGPVSECIRVPNPPRGGLKLEIFSDPSTNPGIYSSSQWVNGWVGATYLVLPLGLMPASEYWQERMSNPATLSFNAE
jgi:hypothetical protein